MRRGRTDAADAAWARVPPGSPSAARAILGRVQLRAGLGRLSEAEELIRGALADPAIDGAGLALARAHLFPGRSRGGDSPSHRARWEALNRAGEADSESAIYLIRGYIERRRSPVPVEVIRSDLDPAARRNPRDDRVWLGKANLAIREGSYDEAARWLDACLRWRPDDVPVCARRLDWAVATNRLAEAREAMRHLPRPRSPPPGSGSWRPGSPPGAGTSTRNASPWSASSRSTPRIAPPSTGSPTWRSGRADRAESTRSVTGRPRSIGSRADLISCIDATNRTRDAEEMARLAERLGRWFEARAFLTVAVMGHPDRDDLRRDLDRLKRDAPTSEAAGRTLSDVVAAALVVAGDSGPGPPSPPRSRPPADSAGPNRHASALPKWPRPTGGP